jgi:hypothetical protein
LSEHWRVRNERLHRVRIACLTLEGLLMWFNVLGLFLTALSGSVTLNRIHYHAPPAAPPPPPKTNESLGKKSGSQNILSSSSSRKNSTNSSQNISSGRRKEYGILPESVQREDWQVSEKEVLGESRPETSIGGRHSSVQLQKDSSEKRAEALTTLTELTRNRRTSRYQAPPLEQYQSSNL